MVFLKRTASNELIRMNKKQAQKELLTILRNQKTISIPKLAKLLNALDVNLDGDNREIKFLKNHVKVLERKMARMGLDLKKWKERVG